MTLTEVFTEANIVDGLAATQKRESISELVQKICASGSLDAARAKGVMRTVMRREDLGTTGIGKGIAVPHGKHAGVKGVIGALGRSPGGVEFGALDGQPVHLIFLLISSPDAVAAHLETLKKITALLRDDEFCRFFLRARNKAELVELLGEADERLGSP